MRPQLDGLWRNGDFKRLWSASTISIFGTLLGALPFTAVVYLHASALQFAMLAAATTAPGLVFGLVAGVWADRLRRRPILIAADLGRAALLASIPAAAAFDVLRMEQLYAVGFLAGTLTIFFEVAYRSYLPSLVTREQLIDANSKMTATEAVAEFGSFSAGGWLVQLAGAPVAAAIDALTYVFSAVFVTGIKTAEPVPARRDGQASMLRETADGLRAVAGDRLLRPIAASVVGVRLTYGMVGALILFYGNRVLGFSPGMLGLIFATGALSSLAGAVISARTTRAFGLGPAMIVGLLMQGAGVLFLPIARGAGLFAAAMLVSQQLVGDVSATVYEINSMSLRQAVAAPHLLGRINASLRFAEVAAMLAGSLAAGLLADRIGLRPTLVVAAGCTFAGALALLASAVRSLRETPAPPEATGVTLEPARP